MSRKIHERVNRSLVSLVLVAALLTLAGLPGCNSGSHIVTARGFHLIDDTGNIVAELSVSENGPVFALRDTNGQDRVRIVHGTDDTGLYVLDARGYSRIGVAQFAHGGGGVALHGPDAKGAAVLYFKDSGSLSFYDDEGVTTYRVPQ